MADCENEHFPMSEPQEIGTIGQYAFWLSAAEARFFDAARAVACVCAVSDPRDNRALVEISNDHDPDEAWHWVRAELEEESLVVQLDKIWEDALWL
jgi:hypothetical protein